MRPRHWVTAGAGSCSEAAVDAGVYRTGRTGRPGEASLSENMAWENLQKNEHASNRSLLSPSKKL